MKIQIILVLVLCVCVIACMYRKRENYGGPIKNIRRIPKSDCYRICGEYYTNCINRYQQGRYVDVGDCQRRRDACVSVCNYTDYQRV